MSMDESSNLVGEIGTPRGWSLALAVFHHGFSCFAKGSVPAKAHTVIETAKDFASYIETGENKAKIGNHHNGKQ